jgi:hypothetical protein
MRKMFDMNPWPPVKPEPPAVTPEFIVRLKRLVLSLYEKIAKKEKPISKENENEQ